MGHAAHRYHVHVSAERAFALSVQAERFPEWITNVVEAKDTTGALDHVGAAYTSVMRIAGRRLEGRWEVTRVERPQLLELTGSAPGGGRATNTTRFEPAGSGTDITEELDYELPGGFLGGLADRLFVERSIERDLRHSAENFTSIIEAEGGVQV